MEDEFTSGPWTGFYRYADGHRERMDLTLSFREGRVTGSGNDPVGAFVLQGGYDGETNEVWWTKHYPGSHDVYYRGFREPRGIWGTWEIGAAARGGFHIWPEGQGQGEGASAEAEADVEEPAGVPAVDPGAAPPSPRV